MAQDTIDTVASKADPSAPPRPLPAKPGRRGRGTRRLSQHSPCLNCGDATPGRFCPNCGQRKTAIQVSLRALVLDTLEEELTVDRRIPATVGALFLEPGQLTVEYVNGRVARYLRPVRLYLLSSLVFFLVFSFMSLQFLRGTLSGDALGPRSQAELMTVEAVDSALAEVRRTMQDDAMPSAGRAGLQVAESALLERRAALEGQARGELGADGEREAASEEANTDIMAFLDGFEPNLRYPALSAAAASKIRQLRRMEPREAAERLAADFLRYAPTVMFLLLPLFALALKVLYIRRRRFYAEHFIFLLHTHAFVFLQFTVLLLLVAVGWTPGWLIAGIVGWTLLYTYLAMKRVYGQGWLKTLVKWWTLGWTYLWILAAAVPLAFLTTVILA
jgi:hypothetical protein